MKNFLSKHPKAAFNCCYAALIAYGLVALFLDYPSPVYNLYDLFLGNAIFGTKSDCILLICFSAFILVLVVSLFIKQCLYKLISNVVFQLVCAVDIYYCIKHYTHGVDKTAKAVEIALDVIFIALIIFETIVMRKKGSKKDNLNM